MDADLSTYQTMANEFHYSVAQIELIGCYFITSYPEIAFWSLLAKTVFFCASKNEQILSEKF
jgi:hypothetical protein